VGDCPGLLDSSVLGMSENAEFGQVASQAPFGRAFAWFARGGGAMLVPEWPGDGAGQGSFGKCRTAQTVPDIVAGLHLAQTIGNPVSMQWRLWSPCRQIPR
jgi:hypothetical protein